jgi:hypothetical protein
VRLRGGQELPRREQPALGVLPAHQRLHPGDPARGQVQHRLVVQHQLVADQGVAQLVGERGAPFGRGPEVGAEDVHPVPPRRLGRVHGEVGVADQVGGAQVAVPRRAGDADAGTDADDVAAELEGPLEGGPQPFGQRLGLGRRAAARQDDELVATEPADGVALADRRGQPGGHLAEQVVAGVVAQGVVDLLEPVDVEEQRGDRRPGRGQVGVDQLVQVGAVRQPGERVVPRLPGRGALGAHPGGHVGVGQDDVARLVHPRGLQVEPAGARGELHGQVGGGGVAQAHRELADAGDQRPGVLVVPHLQGEGEVVAAHRHAEAVVVQHLGGLVPGGVRQEHRAVRVDQQRGRGQRVEDRLDEERCRAPTGPAAHVGGQRAARSWSHVAAPRVRGTPSTSTPSPIGTP